MSITEAIKKINLEAVGVLKKFRTLFFKLKITTEMKLI